jgi:hypothetical protein
MRTRLRGQEPDLMSYVPLWGYNSGLVTGGGFVQDLATFSHSEFSNQFAFATNVQWIRVPLALLPFVGPAQPAAGASGAAAVPFYLWPLPLNLKNLYLYGSATIAPEGVQLCPAVPTTIVNCAGG